MEDIKKIFKERIAKPMGKFSRSAVMILLVEENDELYILFEKRALTLRRQPGDISLPGGAIEPGETPKEAAIRETEEELNLCREDIEYLGEMDYFISPYNNMILPFVGKISSKEIHPNHNEVDHVFKVPLKFFYENEPMVHEIELIPHFKEDYPYNLIQGGKNYKFSTRKYNQYFYIYNNYVIWGFTAQVIKSFIDIVKEFLD